MVFSKYIYGYSNDDWMNGTMTRMLNPDYLAYEEESKKEQQQTSTNV